MKASSIFRQACQQYTSRTIQTSRLQLRPPQLCLRPSRVPSRQSPFLHRRTFASQTSSAPPALTPQSAAEQKQATDSSPAPRAAWRPAPHRNPDEPVYELYITCRVCKERSGHTISKQGYHKGTVLVQCPGCRNRHLIADHLKIFSDKSVTLDQLLAANGEAVQKGLADPTSDMEFWEEAAVTGKMPREDAEDK